MSVLVYLGYRYSTGTFHLNMVVWCGKPCTSSIIVVLIVPFKTRKTTHRHTPPSDRRIFYTLTTIPGINDHIIRTVVVLIADFLQNGESVLYFILLIIALRPFLTDFFFEVQKWALFTKGKKTAQRLYLGNFFVGIFSKCTTSIKSREVRPSSTNETQVL